MKNAEVAELLYDIANILEAQGVEFKPAAYRRAAQNIEVMSKDIEDVMKEDKLDDIPGVGKNIAAKIEEYLKTGKLRYFERLKRELPFDLSEIMSVASIGPKKAMMLYKKLGVKNIFDLKDAIAKHKVSKLEGMGVKTEENIKKGLEIFEASGKRMLLGIALPIAKELEKKIAEIPGVENIASAGSLRRRKETIGDLDILVVTKSPKKFVEDFTKIKDIKQIIAKGESKVSLILENALQVDIRLIDKKRFGAALQYFTGSKEHNINVRSIAIKKGYKLNEYGLFRGKTNVASETECEIYKMLGMDYIEPEMRENTGEMELALKSKLPKIIGYKDIKGDLHVHTKWSDGSESIEAMTETARKMNYKYIAITDHMGSIGIVHPLDAQRIKNQINEIDKLNEKLTPFRILKGAEVDIDKEGRPQISREIASQLDVVICGVHSSFKTDQTKRIMNAIESGFMNIFAHPTGRIIFRREAYEFDIERVFDAAKQNKVFLEINSFIDRLDLNDQNARKAVEDGVKLCISTDSHNSYQMKMIEFGIATARRGWVKKSDAVNTNPVEKLLKLLKR